MLGSRTIFRRATRLIHQQSRSISGQTNLPGRAATGILGGIAGGSLVILAGYGFYHFSGLRQIVKTASTTHQNLQTFTEVMKQRTPPPNEAISWLRSNANFYATFIPGGRQYVDSVFQTIESIQQKHSEEVEDIVNKAYVDLREVSKDGLSIDAATKGWHVLQNSLKRITNLAGESIKESLDNHPEAKQMLSKRLDQLKGLAESRGPDAKRELTKVYQDASCAIQEGLNTESIRRLSKTFDRALERIKTLK